MRGENAALAQQLVEKDQQHAAVLAEKARDIAFLSRVVGMLLLWVGVRPQRAGERRGGPAEALRALEGR